MKLFQKHNRWDNFKKECWERGDNSKGQRFAKEYEKTAAGFLSYLRDIAEGRRRYDELGILDEKTASQIEQTDTQTIQETKYCIGCGKKIPRKANYCPDCGEKQV